MKVRVFRYVRHADVAERLRQGWTIAADLGPPHSEYAVLMEEPEKKNFFRRVVDFVVTRIRIGATK